MNNKERCIAEDKFLRWLNKEHPHHSKYDHDNMSAYQGWIAELRTAFFAGLNSSS